LGTAQGDFPVGNGAIEVFFRARGEVVLGTDEVCRGGRGQDLLSLKVIGKKGNGKRIYIALFFVVLQHTPLNCDAPD